MLEWLVALDVSVRDWVIALPHPPWLTTVMVGATLAGRAGAVWVALGLVRALRRRGCWPAFFRLVLSLAVTFLVVDVVLKPLVGRPRPPWPGLVSEHILSPSTSASFPSGHAASAVAGAFALTRFWPEAWGPLWALAALVVVSRVYLGVHYPLDVLGGAFVGAIVGAFVTGLAPAPSSQASRPPAGPTAA